MKPSMAIKPLVFAIAAVMAVAVQAGQNDRRGHDHHNDHQPPRPTMIPISATATAKDVQNSTNNTIYNEGTENSAEMSGSGVGSSGNVGINVAAGNGNQQDNAAAIANAASESSLDNSFVFGTATAEAQVKQYSNANKVTNWSTQNSAVMSQSASGANGNMGINIAGGDLNQQKNTMAIANMNAPLGNAKATASADQNGPGLTVNNYADRETRVDTISLTKTYSGNSRYEKNIEVSGNKSSSSSFDVKGTNHFDANGKTHYDADGSRMHEASGDSHVGVTAKLDASAEGSRTVSWDYGRHNDGSRTNSFDTTLKGSLEASVDTDWNNKSESSYQKEHNSSFEKAYNSSFEKSGEQSSKSDYEDNKKFVESSSYELSNTISYQVLTPTGWANPVTNTATLSGSVNGGSGNLGVNVAAGVGNQQSNSLAISNTSM